VFNWTIKICKTAENNLFSVPRNQTDFSGFTNGGSVKFCYSWLKITNFGQSIFLISCSYYH